MSETAVLRRAMQALVLYAPGARFWRANVDMRGVYKKGFVGMPDILGWQKHGMALAVEVKDATGRLTAEQHAFLEDVHNRGGLACLYAPLAEGGLEDFFQFTRIPQRYLPREKKVRA